MPLQIKDTSQFHISDFFLHYSTPLINIIIIFKDDGHLSLGMRPGGLGGAFGAWGKGSGGNRLSQSKEDSKKSISSVSSTTFLSFLPNI